MKSGLKLSICSFLENCPCLLFIYLLAANLSEYDFYFKFTTASFDFQKGVYRQSLVSIIEFNYEIVFPFIIRLHPSQDPIPNTPAPE